LLTPSRARITVAALIAAGTMLLTGCSGSGILGNRGGDTSCGDFRQQNDEARNETIKEYLRQKSGNNREPNNMEVNLTKGAVGLYCETIGRDSDPIRSVETGRPPG
jgi:acid stress chaperone HdeA